MVEIKEHKNDTGTLVMLQDEVPFDTKRLFYIYGTNNTEKRGNHAHFELQEFLTCVQGSCEVTLDNGKNTSTYLLDKTTKGLHKDKMIWITMQNFSEDCILLVLCNTLYDNKDYIYDYDEFLKEVN